VRETLDSLVGNDARVMADANNGYTVNLAREFLSRTRDARLYWLEEAFHEDSECCAALREWMASESIAALIADGEGDASPHIERAASRGLVDVIQYDLRDKSLSGWLEIGARLDRAGVRSAPHNYGDPTTNYAAAHLASAVAGFEMIEWDEATVEGISAPGYSIADGYLSVPVSPGFGLELDSALFEQRCCDDGYVLTL
jgi:L-alanine-DL-glutamate epimerase-like enolase superfamily enzyme